MLLPTTHFSALLLLIVSLLCWGSWANTQKMAGKWRFELFYYDYSLGVLLCALIAAFVLGELAPKELSFTDNLLIASKRQMAWGVGAGIVFNLANLLLVAALAVSGMALAFPIAMGIALSVGVVWNYVLNPEGSAMLLFGGVLLVLAAIVIDGFAFSSYLEAKLHDAQKAALRPDPRAKKVSVRRAPGAGRGIVLSIVSGIIMGTVYPMVEMSTLGDAGVAPYGMGVLFGAGVLVSSLFYIPFFLNFPVDGPPLETREYFNGAAKQHLLGLTGGGIWMAGALCNFAAATTPASARVAPSVSYALIQGAALISALWGLFVWREFASAKFNIKMLLLGMIVLFAAGLGMISIAPLHGG